MNTTIDSREKELLYQNLNLLEVLLFDNTTKKTLIWASSNYKRKYGPGYGERDYIKPKLIIGRLSNVIKPRIIKNKTEQQKRSKHMAEVFTPSWICNLQNNTIDDAWFGYKGSFNTERQSTWEITDKVYFPEGKLWEDYVKDIRLEITCGEAPYLVSRYDTVSGNLIETRNRIGLLDRKIRVINENVTSKDEWDKWVIIAYKSIYGYDFQGDNVLIARENLLFSYIDYYKERFLMEPTLDEILEIAKVISWNIWQMDGLKYVVPYSCINEQKIIYNLFDEKEIVGKKCPGCEKDDYFKHNGVYSIIMDWEKNKKIKFINLLQGGYLL